MTEIDGEIMRFLISNKKIERTTYEIAKKVNISWSTANVHLYRLASNKKVKHEERNVKHTPKTFWTVV